MSLHFDVHSLGGHMCEAVIEPHLKVVDLKQAIEESTGMRHHAQMLYAGNYRLCNWEKVADIDYGDITCVRRDADLVVWLDHVDREPSHAMLGVDMQESPPAARADFEIMLAMARRNVNFLGDACPKLLANADFILRAGQVNKEALGWAPDTLFGNRIFVLAALRIDRHALQWATSELRADRNFVKEASLIDRFALGDAAEELLADQDFYDDVLADIRRNYIKESLRSDGRGLRRASDLRGDRDVVMVALNSDPNALEWASPELRDDEHLARAARGEHHNQDNLVRINLNPDHHAAYGTLL